jgi:hypothetical protein
MQTIDDQPETIHLYVIREADMRPSMLPIILSLLALSLLVVVGVASTYQQPVQRALIRVPAVLLPPKIFTAKVAIIPTGIKTYPATTAHGILTITNGSIIGQSIPAGFTIQGVSFDNAVYVPPGNANGYGWAIVSAHAISSGKAGNIPKLSINQVIGSSVYVRNLADFRGGRDGYSIKYATEQDRQTATLEAQKQLTIATNGLHYPCKENQIADARKMVVTWLCQFVTYQLPSYMHISSVRIIGKNLLISVWFVPRPVRYWVK